jgi:hypothetical protein
MRLTHFLYMHEYGTLEPVEVILRRGRGKRESNEGDKPNQGTFIPVWKCHNEIPWSTTGLR